VNKWQKRSFFYKEPSQDEKLNQILQEELSDMFKGFNYRKAFLQLDTVRLFVVARQSIWQRKTGKNGKS
jgi:hypothetical protein